MRALKLRNRKEEMFYEEFVLANETGYSNRDKQSITSSLFLVVNYPTKNFTISEEKFLH